MTVNEAIDDFSDDRAPQTENLRNSSWLQSLGPEFLTLAFRSAHEADPDAKRKPAYTAIVDALLHPNPDLSGPR